MDGVFCPMLPLLTLEVVANAVGVGEELCVGVKRDGVHVSSARFNIAALAALRKTPSGPVIKPFLMDATRTVHELPSVIIVKIIDNAGSVGI